jgi:hypothetical protein
MKVLMTISYKFRSITFSDVIDHAAEEEEEFVPLYQKLFLPSGVMTSKAVTMNVCGCGLDLFASQDLLLE